jgi:5-methylcytosine-specific restriction protein B
MTIADEVREFVLVSIIKPARRKGEEKVYFVSGDIHKSMGLKNRYPLVCNAIDASIFLDYAKVNLVTREGPPESNTVKWIFSV